ncbi:ArpU family phage packaging/lysis transcriptional regulator [Enterococcus dispar]|uniref:ArpU family phage packaging/lysis transcriptional regulator n=1 Tax=Enterococcus dispar TaxID=44009 RepID=UPI00189E8855|nr:ArpU family phage packaging/lysis transcriptional regulator [Enterococcus dispar]
MSLFDVSKYEVPSDHDVDMAATRKNFQTFIREYKNSRERVGQPRIPKVTQSFSLIPPSTAGGQSGQAERLLIQREDDLEAFTELHGLFVRGYCAISHPFKSEVTERRRQIFLLRYMQGFTVMEIMDLVPVSKDVITEESKEAMLQFSHALELTIYNQETKLTGEKSE